jgi:hypothetical protein
MASIIFYYGTAATIKTAVARLKIPECGRATSRNDEHMMRDDCSDSMLIKRARSLGPRTSFLNAIDGSLPDQMPAKKIHGSGPCQSRCVGPVVGGTGVGKGVSSAGVGMKLVRLIPACEFGIELAHVVG